MAAAPPRSRRAPPALQAALQSTCSPAVDPSTLLLLVLLRRPSRPQAASPPPMCGSSITRMLLRGAAVPAVAPGAAIPSPRPRWRQGPTQLLFAPRRGRGLQVLVASLVGACLKASYVALLRFQRTNGRGEGGSVSNRSLKDRGQGEVHDAYHLTASPWSWPP